MEKEFTDKNFKEEVIESKKVTLVDFWAPWCGPCQMMGPIIEDLAKEMGEEFNIGKLNVDENPDSATEYSVMSIPTLKIFKDGKIVKELTGVQDKETLMNELKKL